MRTLIVALLLCGTAAPVLAQDVSGAQSASAKLTAALSTGDAQTAATFFTDDAVMLPPSRATLTGKADIQRFLGNMTRSVKNLKYTPEDLKPVGDAVAREVGTFSFKMRDNQVDGKYLLVWTKVSGDWKVTADMWNRSGSGGGNGGGKNGKGGRQGGGNAGGGMNGGGEEQ